MTGEMMICAQCGAVITIDARFCEQCGAAVPPQKRAPETYLMKWVATLSIIKEKAKGKAVGYVLGGLFGLFFLILVIVGPSRNWREFVAVEQGYLFALGLFLALIALTFGMISVIVYGKYEFCLDDKGVSERPYGWTIRKNAILSRLIVIFGGSKPEEHPIEYVEWKDVATVIPDERHKTITLQKGKQPLMVVACDDEHYEAALQFAQKAVARTRKRITRKKKGA